MFITWLRYNPDAGRGGYSFGDFPGRLAHNGYNETMLEEYTGRLEDRDYVRDIQLAHMKVLAYDYETEIIVRVVNSHIHSTDGV